MTDLQVTCSRRLNVAVCELVEGDTSLDNVNPSKLEVISTIVRFLDMLPCR